MAFLLPWLGDALFGGRALRRGEEMLNGGIANYNTYQTADGKHMAVGALEPKFWTALQGALGVTGETEEVGITQQKQEVAETLTERFAQKTRDEWTEHLSEVDACVEPVLEMDELTQHPHHLARGCFFTMEDPERGPLTQLRLPLDQEPRQTPAPRQGEHTDEVLEQEGVSPAEIQQLRHDRVIA